MQSRELVDRPPGTLPAVQPPPRTSGSVAQMLSLQRSAGNAAVARAMLARQEEDAPSEAQVAAAMSWAQTQRLGEEAIKELQNALGIAAGGAYDEATVAAVYAKQREWRPRGRIDGPGKATPAVFARLGLISTRTITAAGVGDQEIADIRTRFPNGVTVAIYADYGAAHSGAEFRSQASLFARNQSAIGVTGGSVAIGVPVPIRDVSEVIEIVQSIHRGLLAKEQAAAAAPAPAAGGAGPVTPEAPPGAEAVPEAAAGGAAAGAGATTDGAAVPAHTRIKNLALFAHGESWGMGLQANNRFQLHSTQRGVNPPNIAAFVRGIRDAVTPDVGVQLYACSTAHDTGRSDYEEWTGHAQGERTGEHSFAAAMAAELGGDASVYGHTTVGHTTENFAARVYGANSGGGLHMFDVMYPEDFIQSELARLFSDKTEEEQAELHDPLREQMWAHFKDSISGEHHRSARQKRYPVPMGQEMFVNPDNARTLLQTDFQTWVEARRSRIRAPQRRRVPA
jgi:hypothetical protein